MCSLCILRTRACPRTCANGIAVYTPEASFVKVEIHVRLINVHSRSLTSIHISISGPRRSHVSDCSSLDPVRSPDIIFRQFDDICQGTNEWLPTSDQGCNNIIKDRSHCRGYSFASAFKAVPLPWTVTLRLSVRTSWELPESLDLYVKTYDRRSDSGKGFIRI